MAPKQNLTIDAEPTKAFFIDMLTRDIGLQDCVLDLIDNSLHSLIREYDLDVMEALLANRPNRQRRTEVIKIFFSEKQFVIEDTCAGISSSEARNEVFRFGIIKPEKEHAGLSVYGIGMKRAFFKIGREILLHSRTKNEEFEVHIPVDEWKEKAEWQFEFKKAPTSRPSKGGKTGTTIKITNLNKGVAERLGSKSFENELKTRVASTYGLFLKTGIKIIINDQTLQPTLPEIASSRNVKVARAKVRCDGVEALIVAGLTAEKSPHGWYVFCNGRMVVEANRTNLTGWGDNFPVYHNKYNHFVGYVYFRSKDIDRLPWTTTKRSVDFESPVYQCALAQMQILGRPITNFLNKMYPDDIEPAGIPERELLEKAKSKTLDKIPKTESKFSAKPSKPAEIDKVTITYVKPRKDVERIKESLKKPNMSARKAGEYTFDYYLEKECD
jgi:hypothetical protein